jgi:hypothetical protein
MHAVHASTFPIVERPTPDIEQTVRESITMGGYRAAVTVRILAPLEEIAPRVPARSGTVTADGPDACLLRAGADDLHWVAMHLAWLGAPVEVIDPPELLEVIERFGRWAANARHVG